ncbi:MAG: hypothetical protein U0Q18_03580 [Bryobacteraceae bacterium]
MRRQIRELTKIFFGRFLENDLICLDGDTTATLTNILALLAAPGVILPVLEHFIYARFPGKPLYIWDLLSLGEKGFYVCYSMTILGIVIALEWDSLMPDRRDFMILRPFPVRLDFILAAKLAALAAFWGVFTLLINGISGVMFPAVVVQDAGFARLAWFVRCHLLAVLAGNAFMFLAVLAVQGILMNVLGWHWYRRVSPYAQLVLIAGCLVMFLSLSPMSAGLDPRLPLADRLLWYPPAWFTGLYQHDLGWNQPVFTGLAAHAWRMLGLTALIAAVSFALGYKRQVRRSLEVMESSPAAPGRLARALTAILHGVLLRSPQERAAFHFVCHTTLRSRRHRGLLAGWAAGGFALVFNSIAGVMATHTGDAWWESRHGPLLAIPLVLSFFWLCGLRYVFTVPAELPANWLFRVSGSPDVHAYIGGVRKAVALLGIAPLFGLLTPLYVAVWGWTAGLVHIAFGAVIAILLMDALLTGFAKVPFTCSYVPGKANIKSLWALYVFAFIMYVSLFSGLDFLVLEEPSRIVALFVFAALCEIGLYLYRRQLPSEEWQIVFDERPAPTVQTLDLGA